MSRRGNTDAMCAKFTRFNRMDSHQPAAQVAELRSVLGGAALGVLLPVLQRAQIRSLAALKRLSVERLQTELLRAGGSMLTAAERRRRLTTLGLCAVVEAPQEPVQMERV